MNDEKSVIAFETSLRLFTRRRFLGATAGALLFPSVRKASGQSFQRTGPQGPLPPFANEVEARMKRWKEAGVEPNPLGDMWLHATVNYRTNLDRIRQLLPPFLEPDPEAEVQFSTLTILVPVGFETVLAPGPDYGEIDLSVSCLMEGKRYFWPVSWMLPRDYGRYMGRHTEMNIRKKNSYSTLDIQGNKVTSYTERQNKKLLLLEAEFKDEPAHPRHWFRERAHGELRMNYRLHADWRNGPLGDQPITLFRTDGSPGGLVTGMPEDKSVYDKLPRAIDLKSLKFDPGDASPVDPYVELPVVKVLGGSVGLGAMNWWALPVPRENGTKARRISMFGGKPLMTVDPKPFQPFAFAGRAYDPPIFSNKVMTPPGWPKKGTVLRISEDALDRYRDRKAMSLHDATLAIVDMKIEPDLHRRITLPQFIPGEDPALKMVVADVRASDYSTVPFVEAWLLSRCLFEDQPAWFALAHLVSDGGDVITGRETWGYPSKQADAFTMSVTEEKFHAKCQRLYRDVFDLNIASKNQNAADLDQKMTVFGVQSLFMSRSRTKDRLVSQTWQVTIPKPKEVKPADVKLRFPRKKSPGRIGTTDPWFEFEKRILTRATVGSGRIQRFPGAYRSSEITQGLTSFLSDRYDGYQEMDPSKATFVAG